MIFDAPYRYPQDASSFVGPIEASPAISADGAIYFGDIWGSFYALNPDLTEKWTPISADTGMLASPAIDSVGNFYFASGWTVYAYQSTGVRLWNPPFSQPSDIFDSSPVIAKDGNIFIGSDFGYFHKISPSGSDLWSYPSDSDATPAITSDGTVIDATWSPTVINAWNPNPTEFDEYRWEWRASLNGVFYASPAIGPDGTVYIPCTDGRLYAVSPPAGITPSGLACSAWPKFRHDYMNTGRKNTPGTLDVTFGYAGSGVDGNPYLRIEAVARQSDGKVLIGGNFTTVNGIGRSYLARLNFDGTLDTAFNPIVNSAVFALKIQPDGKILVGGTFTSPKLFLLRLNADGTLDTTFNPTGLGSATLSIDMQADGKVLVASAYTAKRLLVTGAPDPTWGTVDVGSENIEVVAVQLDGKIIIGGDFGAVNGVPLSQAGFARLNSNGSLDTDSIPTASLAYMQWHCKAMGRLWRAVTSRKLEVSLVAELLVLTPMAHLIACSIKALALRELFTMSAFRRMGKSSSVEAFRPTTASADRASRD
jgi:uncharacterized delta-60 repeat protein